MRTERIVRNTRISTSTCTRQRDQASKSYLRNTSWPSIPTTSPVCGIASSSTKRESGESWQQQPIETCTPFLMILLKGGPVIETKCRGETVTDCIAAGILTNTPHCSPPQSSTRNALCAAQRTSARRLAVSGKTKQDYPTAPRCCAIPQVKLYNFSTNCHLQLRR